jgi:hypothetical protein
VAVLRDIDAVNVSLASGPAQPWYLTDSSGEYLLTGQEVSTQYQKLSYWRGRQVFDAGEEFYTVADGGNWYGRISGYLLVSS